MDFPFNILVMQHLPLIEARFPPELIGLKITIALTIGLLAGLEREWAHKETGVRTFAIVSLLGMTTSLLAPGFVMAAFAGVLLLVAFTNVRMLVSDRTAEITTSVALMLNFFLGVLVGYGHLFTPVALAIVMTLLLSLKPELTTFTGVLLRNEIRSAVLLGLIGFVIYPLLPNRYIDRWQLLNPSSAWAIVVVLALIGFANYLLLRLYGSRGLYLTAILGGAVNSTATVTQLTQTSASGGVGLAPQASLILLANLAMFLRNLVIVVLFAPGAALITAVPLLAMAGACALIVFLSRPRDEMPRQEFPLPSPVSLKSVLLFGLIFLAIEAAGTLASRFLDQTGYVIVGFIGGLVSSASTTAAAASAFAKGQATINITALSATLASVASVLVNLPIVFRKVPDASVSRKVSLQTAIIIAVGFAALALTRLALFR
jgi:uncharacterized membrane protein (DUF4010 family)